VLDILGLNFHLYGLLIGLGVWAGFEVVARRSRNDFRKEKLEAAFLWTVVFGLIGARLYHVLDYWSRYYSSNWIHIFYVWEGGLGIWGAIVGAIFGLTVYSRLNKQNFLRLLDALVVGAPLAQAIGRLGNWANGEIYGKNGEPLFAYEAVLNLGLFIFLWKVSKKKNPNGRISGCYLMGYGIIRILLEGLRPDDIIWRMAGIPTAIIFGVIAVVIGFCLSFNRRRS
jgi:phosphatidylglycerol:prolipoprotein diacylglycerol transferase